MKRKLRFRWKENRKNIASASMMRRRKGMTRSWFKQRGGHYEHSIVEPRPRAAHTGGLMALSSSSPRALIGSFMPIHRRASINVPGTCCTRCRCVCLAFRGGLQPTSLLCVRVCACLSSAREGANQNRSSARRPRRRRSMGEASRQLEHSTSTGGTSSNVLCT